MPPFSPIKATDDRPTKQAKRKAILQEAQAKKPRASLYPKGRCGLGLECLMPEGELRAMYKCKVCDLQLHPLCGETGDPNNDMAESYWCPSCFDKINDNKDDGIDDLAANSNSNEAEYNSDTAGSNNIDNKEDDSTEKQKTKGALNEKETKLLADITSYYREHGKDKTIAITGPEVSEQVRVMKSGKDKNRKTRLRGLQILQQSTSRCRF